MLFILSAILPAQARDMQFIRDAETEDMLKAYMQPLLQAAGMPEDSVNIYIIADPTINAFVAGGSHLFIHTGLMMAADRPDMVTGVMAHELGHITGGHLVRHRGAYENSLWSVGITSLLSAAAALAGSADAAMGMLSAGSALATQNYLQFSRTQEQAADQAAIGFIRQSHLPAEGLLDMFQVLRRQEQLHSSNPPLYMRSHPLSSDRIAHVRHALKSLPEVPVTTESQQQYDRIRAKLYSFLHSPTESFTRYPRDDTPVMRYARAIAYFQSGDIAKALERLDGWLRTAPNDPYLHELKGQMLFEYGRIDEATAAYREALRLKPGHPLLQYALAQCLTQPNLPERNEEASRLLQKALIQEPRNSSMWRMLAVAEGQQNHMPQAKLALAEVAYLQRRFDAARRLLKDVEPHIAGDETSINAHYRELEAAIDIAEQEEKKRERS